MLNETSTDPMVPALEGEFQGDAEATSGGVGVKGDCQTHDSGVGVLGICDHGHGVHGESVTSKGVVGKSRDFHGVFGSSDNNVGVAGLSKVENMAAVHGRNDAGDGVFGTGARGVVGDGTTNAGVVGVSHSPDHAGVVGRNDSQQRGIGILGIAGESRDSLAGKFEGRVEVTGALKCVTLEVTTSIANQTLDNHFERLEAAERKLTELENRLTILEHPHP
jgi:hypothetical protein